MAARANNSGVVSFGLVSIPIKVYPAATPRGVSFRRLHTTCGSRLRAGDVCPACWPQSRMALAVEPDATVAGYEYSKDRFVTFTPDELARLEGEKTDRFDIVAFVPEETVDFIYIKRSVYLGPDKGGDRAYKLLSEAMVRTKRIAVGRWGGRGREELVLLRPYKGGMLMHFLFTADEVRAMEDVDYPGALEFKKVEEELADKLIGQLSVATFNPDDYPPEYRQRVLAAIEQKAADREIVTDPRARGAVVIDLFEHLKRSLGEKAGGRPPVAKGKPRKRPPPAEEA